MNGGLERIPAVAATLQTGVNTPQEDLPAPVTEPLDHRQRTSRAPPPVMADGRSQDYVVAVVRVRPKNLVPQGGTLHSPGG